MKKLYFLLITLLITSLSFGQALLAEDFDYGSSAGDLTAISGGSWVNHSGTSTVLYATTSLSMANYPSSGVGGSATIIGSNSEDVNRSFSAVVSGTVYASALVNLSAISTGNYFFHLKDSGFGFRARVGAMDDGSGKILFGIGASSSTLTYGTTAFDLNTTYLIVASYVISSGVSNLYILTTPEATEPATPEATNTGTSGTTIESVALRQSGDIPTSTIDGIRVATAWSDIMTASTIPTVSIISPADFSVFAPGTTSVDVAFTTANTQSGDQVDITVNGTTTTNVTSPFNIATTDGQSYTVRADLISGGGSVDFEIIDFSIASITQVSTITGLRAGNEGEYYELTGEATVSYTRTTRNQKYIEDASVATKTSSGSGILIDDSAGAITTTYNMGDGMTGLKGRLSSFSGVLQFVPLEDPGAASSTGNTITPEVVTASELATNWENYESELVEIKTVSFGATGNFATSTNYTINDGTGDLTFRTNFSEADYIGSPIPTTAQNLVVLVAEFNGTPQVTSRALADLTLRIERNAINGFSLYPNPVTDGVLTINTLNNADKKIQIFDILGKQVLSTNLKGRELNVSKLNSGIYILKILEEGKMATRKLVIK